MKWTFRSAKLVCFIALFIGLISNIFALPPGLGAALPATVEPGVLSKTLSPVTPTPRVAQPLVTPKEKPSALAGKAAQEVRFQLTGIVLVGNTVYKEKDLKPLYQDKLRKQITIAELQEIVQSITNYYRNNGYILSRAVLPPQHVANGIIYIRVIEGYIDKVRIIGDAKGSKNILLKYGTNITKSRPLRLSVMEYYLRIANEVPGAQVKAVLEPSKTALGASDLNLTVTDQRIQGYLSYDDYGTLYIGPQQVTLSTNVNSVIRSGDTTRFFIINTTRPKDLKYIDISYMVPMGSNGVTFKIGGNNSWTRPGLNLRELKINGNSQTYYGLVTYPLLRTREQDLTLDAGFNYMDSQVTTGILGPAVPLYTDHIRSVRVGGNYNFSDRFLGANYIDIHEEEGINVLGASHDVSSTTTSRFGGYSTFPKITTAVSRLQQLHGRFSGFISMLGQYSFVPLLSGEQFSFGGSSMGRGYSPAEIIGDRGVGGTIELRMDVAPGWALLGAAQPYVFYDAGVIWNMKNVLGVPQKQSITSTGAGVRFSFTPHISGNFMVAQPLTKQNAAEQVVGNGRRLQSYFSVTAYL